MTARCPTFCRKRLQREGSWCVRPVSARKFVLRNARNARSSARIRSRLVHGNDINSATESELAGGCGLRSQGGPRKSGMVTSAAVIANLSVAVREGSVQSQAVDIIRWLSRELSLQLLDLQSVLGVRVLDRTQESHRPGLSSTTRAAPLSIHLAWSQNGHAKSLSPGRENKPSLVQRTATLDCFSLSASPLRRFGVALVQAALLASARARLA